MFFNLVLNYRIVVEERYNFKFNKKERVRE